MFSKSISTGLIALLLLLAVETRAQDRLQFTFRGMAWSTNAAGKVISIPVNNQSWIQEFALTHGITDTNSLVLAYHLHGDVVGDTIDVVNASTGDFVYKLYGLYKGTDEGRILLANTNSTQVWVIQYLYTDQLDHSAGTVFSNQQNFLDSNGNTNRTVIKGQVRFLTVPDQTHRLQITTGTFVTGKPF